MNAKPGDRVKVITTDEIREGILMPNEETNSVVIKLGNGYNIGIDKKMVEEIKVIERYKEKKEASKKELKKGSTHPDRAYPAPPPNRPTEEWHRESRPPRSKAKFSF